MKGAAGVLVVILLLMMFSGAKAQDVGHTYMLRYNLPDIQTGLALASTADGGFIATGQHFLNGSYRQAKTVRLKTKMLQLQNQLLRWPLLV